MESLHLPLDSPLVSVVVPLFNKERYIAEAIESVLAQSYTFFELVVVNDGSTDGSLRIVKGFNDSRIKIIDKQNEGVAIARNRGVLESAGKLIAFLDADDIWYEDHLKVIVQAAGSFPAAGVFCNAFSSNSTHSLKGSDTAYAIVGDYICEAVNGQRTMWTSAVAMRRSVFDATGGFPPGESHGEDIAVWVRASLISPVVFSGYIGAFYRHTTDGLASKLVRCPDAVIKAINEILASRVSSERCQICLMMYRTRIALAHVISAYLHGDQREAKEFLNVARLYPADRIRFFLLSSLSHMPRHCVRAVLNAYVRWKNR